MAWTDAIGRTHRGSPPRSFHLEDGRWRPRADAPPHAAVAATLTHPGAFRTALVAGAVGVAGAVLPWILGGPNLYWGYENSHLLAGAAILAATIAIAATNERISRLGARVAIGGIGAFFLWQVTTVLSDTGHHDIHVGPGMLVSAIAGVSLIGSAVIGHGERVTHEAPLVSADA